MFLGIDIGTSAVKACVLDAEEGVKATASAPLGISHPFEGASEQHPQDWWVATCKAVGSIDARLRDAVRGIGLSGQMHGAVVLDKSLSPIRPAILWNDARATRECEELVQYAPSIGQVTGVYPMAGFTAPKLLWLSKNEPETHARIAHVLLPKDFVGLKLHGNCNTDPSDAAGTSWLDQTNLTWADAICSVSATDPNWLPPIKFGSDIAGHLRSEAASELGLKSSIPVAAGAGDAAAGAAGIGAVENADGFISLGTSGQLFVTTDAYRPNIESRIHAYAHTLPGTWFQMAAMLNGARPMAWLAELLGTPIQDLLRFAETAAEGPIFLPYLTGERTPHGDSDIRAGFFGLSESTNPGSLMRSVVEAIAFSFADAAHALENAGTSVDQLLAIGGGTRSDFLMQTIASVMGCRLGRSTDSDVGPALGAARLAQLATDGGSVSDIMAKPTVETWFEPDAEQNAALQQKLIAYRALYPALKAVPMP